MSLRRGLDYIALVCQDVASDFENYFRMHLENAKVPPGKGFCTIAQCCVFNNSSIVKHRHQIWDQFVIPVFKTEITNWSWILPQFTSLIRKLALVFFFWWIFGFSKKKFFQPSFRKKNNFLYINKIFLSLHCYSKISWPTFLVYWFFS